MEYRNNHYVPVWYQKRFIPEGQVDQELYYRNLRPGEFVDPRGVRHPIRAVRKLGPRRCFAEADLYTTTFEGVQSKVIEKEFFGKIDDAGRDAVNFGAQFCHQTNPGDHFRNLLMYMSTQKLRTPKGLEWLALNFGKPSQNRVLDAMVRLRQLYCAIWTECVWAIADAAKSDTKFIISDHPVTIYNRRCGPRSQWCRGIHDPDISYCASHTLFPLSNDKLLILTNLSWVRNPYQSETSLRQNPNPFRDAMMFVEDIQVGRHLSEQEVLEINFIIMSRAHRYIAAGNEHWLFPERAVSKANWNTFGQGYLLMPDPRGVAFKGEMYMGFDDGRSTAFDPYGRRPWEPEFGREGREKREFDTLYRFKGEFARLFGPKRRGRGAEFGPLDDEEDSAERHAYHLSLEKKKGRRP